MKFGDMPDIFPAYYLITLHHLDGSFIKDKKITCIRFTQVI